MDIAWAKPLARFATPRAPLLQVIESEWILRMMKKLTLHFDSDPKTTWGVWVGVSFLTVGVLLSQASAINQAWNSKFGSGLSQPYDYPFLTTFAGDRKPVQILQEEIAFYQQRVQIDPDSGLNLASLAQSYYKMGKAVGQGVWYLQAEQAAQRSLASLPFNNSSAILVLAKIREAQHQFQEALALTDQVRAENPHDPELLAVVVTCHLAMGQYQRAEEEAAKLARQYRGIGSLTLLALAKANLGKDAEAIKLFQDAIRLEEPGELGSSTWARTLLGRLYAERGQLDQAEQLYQAALAIIPRYPLALIQSAELELKRGNPKAAQQFYNKVISDSRNGATLHDHLVLRGLARVQVLLGNTKAAQALYNQAVHEIRHEGVGHSGGTFGHRRELAQLLLEQGKSEDLPEALQLMQEEVKIRQDTETLDTLAWALVRHGQDAEAKKILQVVIDRGTRDAGVFDRAGSIAQRLGDPSAAQRYVQASRAIDPTFDAQARRFMGL